MENSKFSTLEELKTVLQEAHAVAKEESILDVLGVTENVISKILAYLFQKHPELLENMLRKCDSNFEFSIRDINVETERAIDDKKRIDVYIYGTFSNESKFYVIIENKTWSSEHDNQCELYAAWLENNYKEGLHYYFFLKPSANITSPHCDKYKVITYGDLYELLSNLNDIYALELNKTIKNNFIGGNMTELEQLLLRKGNFKTVRDCISSLEKQLDQFFDKELMEEIKTHFPTFKFEKEGQSRRFYLPERWSDYQKDDLRKQYYFYLEYIFREHDFDSLEIQAVVKRYCSNSLIDTLFEKNLDVINPSKSDYGSNRWYVLKSEKFESVKIPLSDEWKKEFSNKVLLLFKEYENLISKDILPNFKKLLK